jgi:threonyl-tRNA synthetase
MLHRALFGSLERFTGILLEHYAGWLPFWLAPLQVVAAPISEQTETYALEVAEQLNSAGLTVETDLRNEKIGYKIREHSLAKVPLLIVLGQREMQDGQVTLRWLHGGHQQTLPLAQVVAELTQHNQYPSQLFGNQTGHLKTHDPL